MERTNHDLLSPSLKRVAFSATVHCLTGCAIGEVAGMLIGSTFGWGNAATIALSILRAFIFGYSLTMLPLVKIKQAMSDCMGMSTIERASGFSQSQEGNFSLDNRRLFNEIELIS